MSSKFEFVLIRKETISKTNLRLDHLCEPLVSFYSFSPCTHNPSLNFSYLPLSGDLTFEQHLDQKFNEDRKLFRRKHFAK